ncbi:uncharacterized protein (TIGR03086 family) [Friedmanniella endophytica]|uniref:Uncharacterized protein (TIGR03086 family) n=1 Tax=Microlunatus kandeliicorticis TaxID=1759536 RepID=A0A7W3IV58_9ACTN|nr:TIGR03086 family metal-binding protein [Microlunatus kandeliicorticis]MBA8795789.1 uncharacterized protein (TIGR03086 family) [Microlunatus kandeliicorticis]
MSTPADRYRSLAARFTAAVEAVPVDAWDAPSPCEDWTARDVLVHVVGAERASVTPAGLTLQTPTSADDDPVAAWAETRDGLQALLDDPDTARRGFDGHFGPTTFEQSIEDYYCFDLIVHRWDLARATGGDTGLSADELEFARAKVEVYGDAARMPGVFGPELEPPADADEQTRLLAFLGRRAW